jgi:lipopolysaccharide transport system ATP-binding protein
LLTGILKPTTGTVDVRGRVGALIEVGAGFHPDLSGRENIFLNGSILGLSRKAVAEKFDEIVSFAGLEAFIDTPVKRYSSGMYMRLGFAVAAHTNPDVLLIDEVLAVGDAQFQSRCLRYLKGFIGRGGTVVFVSHAMGQVVQVCERAIWLDHGVVQFDGPAPDAVAGYEAVVAEREEAEFQRLFPVEWAEREAARQRAEAERQRQEREANLTAEEAEAARERWRNDPARARITGCRVLDARGDSASCLTPYQPFAVEIAYRFGRPLPHPVFCLEIFHEDGTKMFAMNSHQHRWDTRRLPPEGNVLIEFPAMPFNTGTYRIDLHLFPDCDGDDFYKNFPFEDRVESAARFRVDAGPLGGHGYAYLPLCLRATPESREVH